MGWSEILTGIGMLLVIEGLVYALAPSLVERLLETLRDMPLEMRRNLGVAAIAAGLAILWLVT
ncbi:MAG: DUF2065 family protein [Pelagimonas sp.]|uniref:DUF2065 family protein n=1 Tax=Pelagimonas sp. TaxID=2073170 RepID=UPI003D6A2B1A